MPSNLRIAILGGCAFFKIHCLENGVLSVLLFDRKRGSLYFPLTLQSSALDFLFFLFGSVVGEKVKLHSAVIFLRCIGFRQDMICNNVHTADKHILVHDPVKQL